MNTFEEHHSFFADRMQRPEARMYAGKRQKKEHLQKRGNRNEASYYKIIQSRCSFTITGVMMIIVATHVDDILWACEPLLLLLPLLFPFSCPKKR